MLFAKRDSEARMFWTHCLLASFLHADACRANVSTGKRKKDVLKKGGKVVPNSGISQSCLGMDALDANKGKGLCCIL